MKQNFWRCCKIASSLFVSCCTYCSCLAELTCSVRVDEGATGESRKATVSYAGGGSCTALVRIEAGEGAYVRFSDAEGWSKSVEFLALGGEGTQNFYCRSDAEEAQLQLSQTIGGSKQIPWTTLGPALKPEYVSADAWQYAEQELKVRLGSTWSDYLARLQVNAEYLDALGLVTRRTDRLLQLEINRALGINVAVPTLAASTDIVRSARGLPLSYTRSFSSAMYAHFNCGTLGYGWTDNYSLYAELLDERTLVIRLPSGGAYSFSKATGDWQPEDARDVTVLTETAEEYKLAYESGLTQAFAKSNMRLKSIADNSGNTLTFNWDGVKLLSVAHNDGQSLTFAYDKSGLLESVCDDLGHVVRYAYNVQSMLVSVTGTDGLVTRYGYRDAASDLETSVARSLVSIDYPDRTTRRFGYETSGPRLASVTDSASGEVRFAYSDVGTIEVTAPDGGVTKVCMGSSGEALKTTDSLGGTIMRKYDGDGLLKSVFAPSGRASLYEHDARGRVATQTSAAGAVTAFDYTELFGNLKSLKDARGNAVSYEYDTKGRATSVKFANGSTMKVAYNTRGDISKTTNCRGQSETYVYDAEGRVTSRKWSNGRTFTYAYDAKGRLASATDSETGAVTMEYDDADRLTRIAYPDDHGFVFAYDECGRLSRRQSFDGAAECYSYDAAGRLVEVRDGSGALYLRNTYDSTTGRLTRRTNGNGTTTDYLYDLMGRVVSIEHRDAAGKISEALQYCYDEDGRCIRASSLLGEERYGYDDDGQLTSVDYPAGPDESFAYDAVGNRTSANGTAYTANNLNQYTQVGSASYTYDKDGNLTSKKDDDGTTTYTYDQQNRLVAVKNETKSIDWSCAYDVLGNRVSVTENGVTTKRVMLPGSLPSAAAEYRDGALVKRHVVVGATQLAEVDAAGNSHYYHGDLIGSTRLVTDASGTTLSRLSYKSFGEVRSSSGEVPSSGYVGTLGVEADSTGLLFMRNRYYDPQLGRFIQRDPIGLAGEDVSLYGYVGNDTILFIDPSGLYRFRTDVAWNLDQGLKLSGVGNKYVNAYLTFVVDFGVFSARHFQKNIWPHLKTGFVAGLRFWPSLFALEYQLAGSLITLAADYMIGDDAFSDGLGMGLDGLIKAYEKYDINEAKGYAMGKKTLDVIGVGFRFFDAIHSMTTHIANNWESLDNSRTIPVDVKSHPDSGGGGDDDPTPGPEGEEETMNLDPFDVTATGNEIAVWATASRSMTVEGSFKIAFSMRVVSETLTAMFQFFVDGELRTVSHSLPVWHDYEFEVTEEGTHTLEWVVSVLPGSKDGATATGNVQNAQIIKTKAKSSLKMASAACCVKGVDSAWVGNAAARAIAASSTISAAAKEPRLYAYERYVLVAGRDYSYRVSASPEAGINLSGLPDGFSFADGVISGKTSANGSQEVTISSGSATKTVDFVVIDEPTGFAEMYEACRMLGRPSSVEEEIDAAGMRWKNLHTGYAWVLDEDWSWDGVCSIRTDDRVFENAKAIGLVFQVTGPTSMSLRYSKSYPGEGLFWIDLGALASGGEQLYMDCMPGIKMDWKSVVVDIPAGTHSVVVGFDPGPYHLNKEGVDNGFWIDDIKFGSIAHEPMYTIEYSDRYGFTLANPLYYTESDLPIKLENSVPYEPGYAFVGWMLNGKTITEIPKGTTGNITLVAVWKKLHTVTFDLGLYGVRTGGGELSQTVMDGEAATAPEFVVVDGWTFAGWNASFDHVTSDLTVTAQWKRKRTEGLVEFAAPRALVEEGGMIVLEVWGGNAEKSSSVAVYLTYQTAAAADIDLKTATVDGVTPKGGLKFPLSLSWVAGDTEPKTIMIPVKTDKTVEDDEMLVFQLAAAQGMEFGDQLECAVKLADANEAATLQDGAMNPSVKLTSKATADSPAWRVGLGNASNVDGSFGLYHAESPPLSVGKSAELLIGALKAGTLYFYMRFSGPIAEEVPSTLTIYNGKLPVGVIGHGDGLRQGWALSVSNVWSGAWLKFDEKGIAPRFVFTQGSNPDVHVELSNFYFDEGKGATQHLVFALSSDVSGGYVTGSGHYVAGTTAKLKATALPGWAFKHWVVGVGDGTLAVWSQKASVSWKVTSDLEVLAVFERIPYVAGLADPADGGKVTGSGYCASGKKVTLKAKANKNFTFVGWCDDKGVVATQPTLVVDRSAKPAKPSKTQDVITNVNESVTYYARFVSDPEVFVTVAATDGKGDALTGKGAGKYVAGTIAGAGKYAKDKKVTLRATANKGYVFAGWYEGGVDGGHAGRVTLPAGEPVSRLASYVLTMPTNDVAYVAKFVTTDEDEASISANVNGMAFGAGSGGEGAVVTKHATNVMTGVYLEWPIAADALSLPTVKVAGLPSGLKFTAKPVTKTTGSGTSKTVVTNVAANTIYGTPTAASKVDKYGDVTPSKVKVTVTTAGKSKADYVISLMVDPIPAFAVGTFDGWYGDGDDVVGSATLTLASNGKVSGKVLMPVDKKGKTYNFKADSLSGFSRADDGSVTNVTVAATLTGENKSAVPLALTFALDEIGIGCVEGAFDEPWSGGLWLGQNGWKRGGYVFPNIPKNIVKTLDDGLTLTFKKSGVVTIGGKIVGDDGVKLVSAKGSAQLVSDPESADGFLLFVYVPPAKNLVSGLCRLYDVELVDAAGDNVVTDVKLVER